MIRKDNKEDFEIIEILAEMRDGISGIVIYENMDSPYFTGTEMFYLKENWIKQTIKRSDIFKELL
jgi:hypothetical protein